MRHAEPIRAGRKKLAKTERDQLRKLPISEKSASRDRRAVTGELKTAGD
jgi:hypothetical protein